MNKDLIVCACKQVTLGNIIDVVKKGENTLSGVIEKTGATTICSGCRGKFTAITENLFLENQEGNL